MSSNVPIGGPSDITAPTPQNTPLTQAPINFGLSRPTVPDISEEKEGDDADDDVLSMDDLKETMMGMVEGKLATLLGKSSGYIESLPMEIKLNVEGLKGLQVKQNELHQKYKLECLELEKKVGLITSNLLLCYCVWMVSDYHGDPRSRILEVSVVTCHRDIVCQSDLRFSCFSAGESFCSA